MPDRTGELTAVKPLGTKKKNPTPRRKGQDLQNFSAGLAPCCYKGAGQFDWVIWNNTRRVALVNLFPSAFLGFITQKWCLPAHTLYTLQKVF